MLFKDYVKSLVDLLNDKPKCGELDVWCYCDQLGDAILPMHGGSCSVFVKKDAYGETEEYVPSDYLEEHLDEQEITIDEFLVNHKQIILL